MSGKLRAERGLTIVELLCAVLILILLGLLLNVGLQLAMHSYQAVTARAESRLLLSSLSEALADDLRYARDVETDADGNLISYSSDSYNSAGRASLEISAETGQVMAGDMHVLPGGAYGNGNYTVQKMEITCKTLPEGCFFTVKLRVGQAVGNIGAETEFTVRCLSGPKAGDAEPSPGEENAG